MLNQNLPTTRGSSKAWVTLREAEQLMRTSIATYERSLGRNIGARRMLGCTLDGYARGRAGPKKLEGVAR